MDTLDKLKSYSKTTIFYLAAKRMCHKRGIKYNFPCPLCGGTAHAKITINTLILCAHCDSCKVKLKEKVSYERQ